MPEAVTKRPRRRTLAVAMLMLATTAGATVAGIAAASAAEPAHFAALAVPTPDDPAVGGNGIAPSFGQAERLALSGLRDLCVAAGYIDVDSRIITNSEAARSGQSTTPDGNILFTAFAECAGEAGQSPAGEDSGATSDSGATRREEEPLFRG